MIIYNKFIPVKGFKCLNLFGLIFARSDKEITDKDILHEKIHTKQIIETLGIFFYIWYGIEWFIKLFTNKFNSYLAYRATGFEREAYGHHNEPDYLSRRKPYSWINSVIL